MNHVIPNIDMKITKNITHRIELIDPNEIYSPDPDAMCLKILEESFLNRCYKSCYITKIVSILNRSKIYMKNELDGGGYTNVHFKVEGIIYQEGDIINDCKIVKIESNGITHGITSIAGVQFRQSPVIYEVGDVIPISVIRVGYNPYASQVSIYAEPFKPALEPLHHYKLTGEVSNEDKTEITRIFSQIQAINTEIKKLPKLNQKILALLDSVIYPIKKQEVPPDHEMLIFDMKNILSQKDDVVTAGNPKYLSPVYFRAKKQKGLVFIPENRGKVFKMLLYGHLNRLNIITDFAKSYPDKKSLEKSVYLQKTYRK